MDALLNYPESLQNNPHNIAVRASARAVFILQIAEATRETGQSKPEIGTCRKCFIYFKQAIEFFGYMQYADSSTKRARYQQQKN